MNETIRQFNEGTQRRSRPAGKIAEVLLPLVVLLLFAAPAVQPVRAREVVDMTGKRVQAPDRITRVYCASPPATYLLYALDDSLLVGVNYPFPEKYRKYLRPGFNALPVLGGWFGQGKTPNMESLLAMGPEIMIDWLWKMNGRSAVKEKVQTTADIMMLPTVYMKADELRDYPEAILFMGKLVNREERAKILAEYARDVITRVETVTAAIPEEKKVSVYYAEERDGLATDCDRSYHAELINLSGGRNIYRCEPRDTMGMEKISLEEVIRCDPQVILVKEEAFFDNLPGDPRWRDISAVKNGRVHLIPSLPFNWFDRPPSFMRLLGLQWLTHLLYPELLPMDMAGEIRRFYKLFLDLDLDDAQLKEVANL